MNPNPLRVRSEKYCYLIGVQFNGDSFKKKRRRVVILMKNKNKYINSLVKPNSLGILKKKNKNY